MKKFLLLSMALLFDIAAMAQTLVVEDNQGNKLPYDVKQVTSIDIQASPAGFTVNHQGKSNQYEFTDVKGIATSLIGVTGNKDNGNDLLDLYLLDNNGSRIYPFLMNDSLIHIKIPNYPNLDKLTLVYKHNGEKVYFDSEECLSETISLDVNDFTKADTISVISSEGKIHSWALILYDLPVMMLNTPNSVPIESKTERVENCCIKLVDSEGVLQSFVNAGVRGRGNSTWKYPKKPYNVKFESKVTIPGFDTKSKHWILLSNPFYDRSQMHNALAFEMTKMTDYPWVQSGEFVELILNGVHQGLYYLCEQIREEKGKIDLKEEEGDYLLESFYLPKESFDESLLEEEYFKSSYFSETGSGNGVGIVSWEVKYPDEITAEKVSNIKHSLEDIEEMMYEDEKLLTGLYRERFDIETAINWLLVQEATLNDEASRTKNVYIYKKGNMLYFGPPWDFDARTFGLNGTKKWTVKNTALYFPQLFKDPIFINRLKEKWGIYRKCWEERVPNYVDQLYQQIHRSAERNEQMWPNWHNLNKYGKISYKQLVDNIKDSFLVQLQWMDEQIGEF